MGWLLIPEEGSDTPVAGSVVADVDSVSKWIGVALIVAAALVVLSWTELVRGDFLVAAVLLGVGVLLFRGDLVGKSDDEQASSAALAATTTESGEAPPEVDTAPEPAAEPAERDVVGAVGEPEDLPQAPVVSPPPPAPPPARPRRRSILGRLTFAALLLTLGVMAALDAANLTRPELSDYIAAVVIVAGGGLLIGALWGRSYGLIALGLIMLPVLALTTLVRIPFQGEIGEQRYEPTLVSGVAEFEMAIGEMTVDLRQVARGEAVTVQADLGIGELIVLLPDDRTAVVDAEVGIGAVDASGQGQNFEEGGIALDRRFVFDGDTGGDPLQVSAETGIGVVTIRVCSTTLLGGC